MATILPTLLSALSALGVAYFAFVSTTTKTETDSGFRDREISLEQTKFDAAVRQRFEDGILKVLAQILSKNEEDRLVGRATLLTLYPDRAEDVLKTVASVSGTPETKAALQAQANAVESLAKDTWVVVAGGDTTLESANTEVARASKADLTATVYHRAGSYRTVVGPFPTRSDADRANIAVRAYLRSDAYPVRLSTWCPSGVRDPSGYVECGAGQ